MEHHHKDSRQMKNSNKSIFGFKMSPTKNDSKLS